MVAVIPPLNCLKIYVRRYHQLMQAKGWQGPTIASDRV